MRNAKMILVLAVAAMAAGACQKQQKAPEQNISMDADIPDNQVAAGNMDLETLPADESSTTPSNQLQNGFDAPDVNDVGPTNQ